MYIGSTVAIICYSWNPPIWTKNGKPVQMSKVLVLTNVQENDTGYYFCNGILNYRGQTFRKDSQLFVGGIYRVV